MAGYYNPYYDFAKEKSGSDFIKESGAQSMPSGNFQSPFNQQQGNEGSGGGGQFWQNNGNAIIGGISQIGGAIAQQGSSNPNNFSIDPWAGYTGSLQGFAQGGAIGAIAGGVSGQIKTFNEVNRNLKKLNTGVNLSDVDPLTGKPVFVGGNAVQANSTIGELNKGEKAIKKSLDPATRVLSGLYGTRKKIKRKRGQIQRGLQTARDAYNNDVTEFNDQQLAFTQYNQLLNNQNRMRSLNSIGTSLY